MRNVWPPPLTEAYFTRARPTNPSECGWELYNKVAEAETLGNCRAGKADAKIYTTKLVLKLERRISGVTGGGVSLSGPEARVNF